MRRLVVDKKEDGWKDLWPIPVAVEGLQLPRSSNRTSFIAPAVTTGAWGRPRGEKPRRLMRKSVVVKACLGGLWSIRKMVERKCG